MMFDHCLIDGNKYVYDESDFRWNNKFLKNLHVIIVRLVLFTELIRAEN